jgi:RimJ/RimL family protein N-acetyltransferase
MKSTNDSFVANRHLTGAGTPKRTDGVVILTPFVESDAPVMRDADGDAEIRRWFDFPADFVPSLEHSREVIRRWDSERTAGTRFPFAVRSATTNELLGGCELRPTDPGFANLSYWTYAPHRRRGVASRAVRLACEIAFGELGVQGVEVVVNPKNAASRAVVEGNGFARSGERDGRIVYVRIPAHKKGRTR